MRSRKKLFRFLALFVALNMVVSAVLPTISFALTSGPTQPEFTSFEPVATTNMVNDFTGDFTYNLPLIEVPGPHGSSYPLSLSYHSGVMADEEASWVGYGWTLNAGAINRAAKGLPDDYKNKAVTNYNKAPKNWTATVGGSAAYEFFSKDIPGISVGRTYRYNNYKGFGVNDNFGISFGSGILNIGYGVDNGSSGFSLGLNPGKIFEKMKDDSDDQLEKLTSDANFRFSTSALEEKYSPEGMARTALSELSSSIYGLYISSQSPKPATLQPYQGKSINLSFALQKNLTNIPAGRTTNIRGTYTWQENLDSVRSNAYGYMYSGEASMDTETLSENLMDYGVDGGSTFSKKDTILGVPFNQADQFVVTGEGVGGGFRLHHRNIGHFGPKGAKSSFEIRQLGGELSIGKAIGAGLDIGIGNKKSELKDWDRFPVGSGFSKLSDQTVDEPVFFRFNNDMGGSLGADMDDEKFSASVGNYDYTLAESGSFSYSPNNNERSGRSSFIGFNLNKDVYTSGLNPSYKAYSKRKDLITLAHKYDETLQDNIGELAIFNENGLRYIYGLPVYNKNEETYSLGVSGGTIQNYSRVHFPANEVDRVYDAPKLKMGQRKYGAYASSFLLTEITTPDYIDRGLDGPTVDDFGGYTRFNYKKVYGQGGEHNKWYNWRTPYNGLEYQRNTLSDTRDDIGSVVSGEKEIYYMQSIETKSHVAIFHLSDRAGDSFAALPGKNALLDGAKSNDRLKRLDKIELYPISAFPKDDNGLLVREANGTIKVPSNTDAIKTVHFVYASAANELAKNAPNTNSGRGKLTLKSVYFEYNGHVNEIGENIRISPYQFEYAYPDQSQYPAKYRTVDDVRIQTAANQNPDYSEFNSDAWGSYQPDGAGRNAAMRTWLDQKQRSNTPFINEDGSTGDIFDPAVWQLKVIKLPSGGEIHVQYESDDYQYVQDQEAHVMASLVPGGNDNTFLIDPESIGIMEGADPVLLNRLQAMLTERYVGTTRKIYFKFLYQLLNRGPSPAINNCNSEFITGYASVDEVNVISANVDGATKQVIELKLTSDQIPKSVCTDYTQKERIGLLDPNGDCYVSDGLLNDGGAGKVARQLWEMRETLLTAYSAPICGEYNEENSYFRIPTPLPKRGGGLRVKRLMTFDQGLESNPVLYGSEYSYTTIDEETGNEISSGVATYEPQSIREENIMVDYLDREGQGVLSKLIAGGDKKEQEGPIGESIYPSPSVGYSKVTIENIHRGETNTGFTVHEYHTAKRHPLLVETTEMEHEQDFDFVFGGLFNHFYKRELAAQGFSFILNNMHGQVERMATYSGNYSGPEDANVGRLVSKQEYKYYENGEKVKVLDDAYGTYEEVYPGREVDVTLAQKYFSEELFDANIEVDVTFGITFGLPIIAKAVPSLFSTDGAVATHAATKVVSYPAIVKKTTTYQDGIYHHTEPLAFDKYTGRPVVNKSYDEFENFYVSNAYRASWEYEGMSDKASSEGKLIDAAFVLEGDKLKLATGEVCDLKQFTRGDLIELGDGTQALFHVEEVDHVTESLKVQASQQNAAPDITTASNIRIIRSGRMNRLNADVGSLTRHNPSADPGSVSGEETYLGVIPEDGRYGDYTIPAGSYNPQDFATDLDGQLSGVSGEGSFTLSRTYIDMNMSAYEGLNESGIDWQNVSVKDIEVRYKVESDHIVVDIMAFKIICGSCTGGIYEVRAEGW